MTVGGIAGVLNTNLHNAFKKVLAQTIKILLTLENILILIIGLFEETVKFWELLLPPLYIKRLILPSKEVLIFIC